MKLEKSDILKRFTELSPRERALSVGTFFIVVLYGLYLLIVKPINEENALLQQKISAQRQTYQQLKKISAEVAALRTNDTDDALARDAQSLMTVIDASSKQLEISEATKRTIPDGTDKVTLWLEDIAFDKLIYWLAVLETNHGIKVDQINIQSEQKTGAVNAKLTLST